MNIFLSSEKVSDSFAWKRAWIFRRWRVESIVEKLHFLSYRDCIFLQMQIFTKNILSRYVRIFWYFLLWEYGYKVYRITQLLQLFILAKVSLERYGLASFTWISYIAPQFSQKLIVIASLSQGFSHWHGNITRSHATVISCMSHWLENASTIR
jgi:hypothetical protein